MTRHLHILGLGFSGLAIAGRARAAGWTVTGTATTAEKGARLRAEGIDALLMDNPALPPPPAFAAATHLLSTVPPNEWGDSALQHVIHGFRYGPSRPAWLGYLSTTGVYGDTGGAWV